MHAHQSIAITRRKAVKKITVLKAVCSKKDNQVVAYGCVHVHVRLYDDEYFRFEAHNLDREVAQLEFLSHLLNYGNCVLELAKMKLKEERESKNQLKSPDPLPWAS